MKWLKELRNCKTQQTNTQTPSHAHTQKRTTLKIVSLYFVKFFEVRIYYLYIPFDEPLYMYKPFPVITSKTQDSVVADIAQKVTSEP